jgi:NADH:ubiquinone oxidoreductase subunit B-like Fe-S oxidoreductase
VPVAAYIPGCPASPKAIIDGVVKLLGSIKAAGEGAPPAPVAASGGDGDPAAEPQEEREAC